MSIRADILRHLLDGAEYMGTMAKRVGVSRRTMIREVAEMEAAGLVDVLRGGGRGHETRVAISDKGAQIANVAQIPGRVFDDPSDMTPGAEYTRLLDEDAARRDRAARYHARFGKWPSWAEVAQ